MDHHPRRYPPPRHQVPLHAHKPPAVGEPFHNDQIAPGCIHISNRAPDEKYDFEAREIIDAGFLELVRYGIRRADNPLIIDSLKVVDHSLKIETPFGDCWRRYNHDGYGQRKDGSDYDHWGQGRAWPILTGERAHYELAAGMDISHHITALERFSSIGGMMPEQIWDHADIPSAGMYLGRSAGSAQPLVWAHSEYVKLLRSVTDDRVFDHISVVEDRYAVPAAQRTFSSQVEIFQTGRAITRIPAGLTLRILDPTAFQAVWTMDDWATTNKTSSKVVGYPGSYVDIPTNTNQTGTIIFTLYWPAEDRWLGKNISIAVTHP